MKRLPAAVSFLSALALGAAALLTGSAAAPADGPATPEVRIPAVHPVAVPATVLPLDAYYPTPEQDVRLQRAEQVARRACLRGLGLDMALPATYTPGLAPNGHARLFGIVDPAEGAAVGYHGWGDPDEADRAREAEVAAQRRAIDDAAFAALAGYDPATGAPVPGAPAGGCVGQAERRLAAGGPVWDTQLLDSLALGAGDRAAKDPRLVAGTAAWSACMAASGYAYPDPLAAGDDPAWATRRATEAERAVAATDALCKERTGLVALWTTVTADHQRRTIAADAARLSADAAALRTTLATADRVLARG